MSVRVCDDGRLRALTFSQLLQCVATDDRLALEKKYYFGASIRAFIRLTGADPSYEPATFNNCRDLGASVSFAACGIRPKYWTALRGRVAWCIRRYGEQKWSGALPRMSRGWRNLVRCANGNRAVTHGLSRFMRFCTVSGVSPSRITNDVVARYRVYLIDHSLVDQPHSVYRRTVRNWNWAAKHVEGWPKRRLRLPRRDAYILPWESFPPSFRAECERWKECVVAAHPLDPRAPKRPITRETADRRLRYLRAFASAIVREGVPSRRIRSLADLAKPKHLRKGVTFFWERAGRRPTAFQCETYRVIRSMSQYWLGADPAIVAMMSKAAARCRRPAIGITGKALGILQQFDDQAKLGRLLDLPRLLTGLAAKQRNPHLAALTIQRALAIELLLIAPIRVKNLSSLCLDRHFVRVRDRHRREVRLAIPRDEVKNAVPLDFPLPQETVELLDRYVRHDRRVLLRGRRTSALFPGRIDGHVHSITLCAAITRVIQRYTGVLMNVHAFRHLSAKLFLERYPQRYDLVASLLGHKSIETTRKYYCSLEMQAVSRQYSTEVLGRQPTNDTDHLIVTRGQLRAPSQIHNVLTRQHEAASFNQFPLTLRDANQRSGARYQSLRAAPTQ